MMKNEELVPSSVDVTAPIDFDAIKRQVAEHGPLRVSRSDNPYSVLLTPTPCRCVDEGCEAELVMVSRKHGLFEMQWIVSKEDFVQFESVDAFYFHVAAGGLQDSRGERMIIERHVDRISEKVQKAKAKLSCTCPKCLASHGDDDTRNIFLISQLKNLLEQRHDLLLEAMKLDEEDSTTSQTSDASDDEQASGGLESWVNFAFEIGYSLGRNFSEYSGKAEIEPLALLGLEAEGIKRKREVAAGEKSRKLREERRAALFNKIADLAERNPDIVKFGPELVAKVAVDECAAQNPTLWSQGRGQVADYIGEIRRGEAGAALQGTYRALFGTKPLKGFGKSH